eukprot:2195680-Rhodomonas_salina.4
MDHSPRPRSSRPAADKLAARCTCLREGMVFADLQGPPRADPTQQRRRHRGQPGPDRSLPRATVCIAWS